MAAQKKNGWEVSVTGKALLSKILGLFVFALIVAGLAQSGLAGESGGHGASGSHGGGGHNKDDIGVRQPKPDHSKAVVPGRVNLVEPKALDSISGTSATLKWTGAEGAETYHVQVATDSRFKWIVTENHNLAGTSFEVSGLEPKKTYYWRVAARRPNNDAGATKGAFSFSSFETK